MAGWAWAASPGGAHALLLMPQPPLRWQCGHKENTMSLSETEIHQIVLRMLREGYAALTFAERKVVDALMAVC